MPEADDPIGNPKQWMPWYISAYLEDTQHLPHAAFHGAYLLLLGQYWLNGPLPDDDEDLAAIAKVSYEEWTSRIGRKVRPFFVVGEDGRLHQERADREIQRAKEIVAKKRAAGKKGAESRWGNSGQTEVQDLPNPMAEMANGCTLTGTGKEESDTSYQAPSAPRQASFLPEPEKVRSPYEALRGELLPLIAEMAGYADDANGRMKAGKLFNQLYSEIAKDGGTLREIVTRIHANAETRDKGIACIKAEILARKSAPRLVVDNDAPPDHWGIETWCRSLPGGTTPTQSDTERANGKHIWNGKIPDAYAREIAKAALLPKSWRGNWSAVEGWIKARKRLDEILPIIRTIAERDSYEPSDIQSIAFFDAAVRGGRRAA